MLAYREKVASADIVSFDVFDTLLIRNVARPIDLFKIVRENFNQFTRYYISADFADARVKAEHNAYEASVNVQHATLDDIYTQFQRRYGYGKDFCETLKMIEMKTEREALRANPKAKEIYGYACKQRKKILIVSDMYLPKQVIADTLTVQGYTEWHDIIVSCHDKFSKHDGSVYAHIRKIYADQRVLHIGDNIHSDISWAEAYGIETIHIEQNLQELSYETTHATQTARGGKLLKITNKARHTVNDAQQSVVTALIAHKIVDPAMTEFEAIGYGTLGPLLLGFVQWLHDAARAVHTDHLYFLARDGAVMQRAYQAYYAHDAIDNTYLFASRRLYNFAKIEGQLTQGDVDFLIATNTPLKTRAYYERFGLSMEHADIIQALETVFLEPDQVIDGDALHRKLRASFMLSSKAVLERSAQERAVLLDYFSSMGLDKTKRSGVVDIGWAGTLQKSLGALTGISVQSFLFGVHDVPSTRSLGSAINGFIDQRLSSDELFHRIVFRGIECIEYLFTNPDQESVTAIRKDGKTFQQVMSKVEKTEDSLLADASLRVIQTAALDFVRDYKDVTKNWADSIKRLDRAVAFQELSLLIQEPSDQQAIVIGRVKHSFVDGLPPRSIGMPARDAGYYRVHRDALREEYEQSYWKEGFRKNISILHLDPYL